MQNRLQQRYGNFMDVNLLQSQLVVLEEPEDAIVANIIYTPQQIVAEVLVQIN